MNLLYPKIPRHQLPLMLRLTLAGALVGGLYGLANDQITYALGPEYFTKLKFHQFAWADVGLPPRLFVAEIGFLAAGAVGAFAGWLIGRIAVPVWPARVVIRRAAACFSIMLAFALTSAVTGWMLGNARRANPDFSNWDLVLAEHHVTNAPDFVLVAYIHNASYLGGLAGLLACAGWLVWKRCGDYSKK